MSKRYPEKNPFMQKDYVRGKNHPFVYIHTFAQERLFIVTPVIYSNTFTVIVKHHFSSVKILNS